MNARELLTKLQAMGEAELDQIVVDDTESEIVNVQFWRQKSKNPQIMLVSADAMDMPWADL